MVFDSIIRSTKGSSTNYVVSTGGRGGQKLHIFCGKRTTKRREGVKKLPILTRHNLWMAPKFQTRNVYFLNRFLNGCNKYCALAKHQGKKYAQESLTMVIILFRTLFRPTVKNI